MTGAEQARALAERLRAIGRDQAIIANRRFLYDVAQHVIDAEAELREARKVLTWIADPSYIGNYDQETTIKIYRQWATSVLARAGAAEKDER